MGKAVVMTFTNEDPLWTVGTTDPEEWPQRALCDSLHHHLQHSGIQCTPPGEHGPYRCDMHAVVFGRRFTIVVQGWGQWWMQKGK
jgi:hypothetical protein